MVAIRVTLVEAELGGCVVSDGAREHEGAAGFPGDVGK